LSTDESLLITTRQADGSLPNVDFLKLKPGSDLIDKGMNLGFAFYGTAPDLGAFEAQYTTAVLNPESDNQILFYPNPAKQTINFLNHVFKSIEILDIHGNQLLNSPFKVQLDLNFLQQGIYLLKITTNENQYIIKKLIKN
jgi:hypothetical protein